MKTADLERATCLEIAAAVREGRTTAAAVVDAALARIEAIEPVVNAFTDVLPERARGRAKTVEAGPTAGPLAGVPFAAKNLFDVAGLPTRAGSKIQAEGPPAASDATLIARLEAAGAVLVGALNMGEYAFDFTGENAHYGPSRNPHDPTRMSGGSSGGSAAAVAAGEVPLSLGSDTNGSIRVPASFCGVFGLKPTYGRLGRGGTFPFVDSLDHLGPLARSVEDLAVAFDLMQGPDPLDPACTDRPPASASSRLTEGTRGLRLAVAGGYFAQGAEPEAFAAVRQVARALDVTASVEIPEAAAARAAAFVITCTEAADLHLERLRARSDDFDPETRDRFLAGAILPGVWYVRAQRFRRRFAANLARLFEDIDIVIAPATPCVAPRLGQKTLTLGGVVLPVRGTIGMFTQPISLSGLPVVAVPTWTPSGLPIGVQVIARPFEEQAALRVAARLQEAGVCACAPN